jgi:hypothetical protein
LTVARKGNGSCTAFSAAIRASTFVARGSYVATASCFSRLTCARVTPLTPSSADRTAAMQPSQTMPSTARVTVAVVGAAGGAADRCASLHAPARNGRINSHSRLVTQAISSRFQMMAGMKPPPELADYSGRAFPGRAAIRLSEGSVHSASRASHANGPPSPRLRRGLAEALRAEAEACGEFEGRSPSIT